jgi:malonate transporter and related proteins
MSAIAAALLPIFAVIMCGLLIGKLSLVSAEQWQATDHLCYVVLFPVIIFREIAGAEFATVPVFRMAAAMVLALCTMFAVLLAIRHLLKWPDGPEFASMFQGASRWNTFLTLSIIAAYFGPDQLKLGAVGAAVMIPLLNVVNVAVHASYVPGQHSSVHAIAMAIIRNPYVISSAAGVLYKLTGLPLPQLASQTLQIIGSGGLGLALLTVGASLQLSRLNHAAPVLFLASMLKLAVLPMIMAGWLWVFGVDAKTAAVTILCGAVPTASGAYVLAQKMGGDAVLMANMITFQTIAAFVTLPVVLYLLT